MSDVVAVAAVTAGASLIAAAIGALSTYKVAQRSKEAAIATATDQNAVELAKIEAENTRLRTQYAEEERRNRQATYHRTVAVLQRLHGADRDSDEIPAIQLEWLYCLAGVQIFGSPAASTALGKVQGILDRWPPFEDDVDAWQKDLAEVAGPFIEAVRDDIKPDGLPV